MTFSTLRVAIRAPLWIAGLTLAGAAHTATRSTLDLSAGAGASSNPSLQVGGRSSAFGRISALGTHEMRSERTTTSIALFGENTTYLKGYGSKQIFDVRGRILHQVSPNLSIFGNLGFNGDFGGQLSGRFASLTPDLNPSPPEQLPPSVILDDPGLTGLGGRRYRLIGQAGLSLRASARSSISLSAGAQRNTGTGALRAANYNNYSGNASYDHQISERTSAGLGVSLQYQDYDNGRSSSVLNPSLTASHQFSDQIQATAAVGVLLTRQDQPEGGSAKSVNPSFSFGLCQATERGRLCGRASRNARSSFGLGTGTGAGSLAITTSAGIDYSRSIDANQSIQMALSASHDSTKGSAIDGLRSTYLSFLAGYDRKFRERLAVGANGGARKRLFAGSDPKTDITASAYVRYRLGDIQ